MNEKHENYRIWVINSSDEYSHTEIAAKGTAKPMNWNPIHTPTNHNDAFFDVKSAIMDINGARPSSPILNNT